MKHTTRTIPIPALALLAVSLAVPGAVLAQEAGAYGDDYRAGTFGRVRYQENGVTITRASADRPAALERADVNAPVFPGDAIATGPDQRVEVELAQGSVVRLDRASAVVFLALPDPYADVPDNTVLQLSEGTIRVNGGAFGVGEFRVDTPSCSVYVLDDADMRVEVGRDGTTLVASRRGVLEVAGETASVIVRGGTSTEVVPGAVPADPWAFNTFLADSFDRWVDEREAASRLRDHYADTGGTYEALPGEVQPYYEELTRHGDWVDTADYGYVWQPVGVAADWRPYHDGYWSYGPHGYFWVSYEPWGWAPYRYGRWHLIASRGWCWIPGRVFAGAWVSWSWTPSYVGWSPLNYWNRPAIVVSVNTHHHHHGYDPHAWTFVGYDRFGHHNARRYALPHSRVRAELDGAVLLTRAPRVSPRELVASAHDRRQALIEGRADRATRLTAGTGSLNDRVSLPALERRLDRRVARGDGDRTPAASARPVAPPRVRSEGGIVRSTRRQDEPGLRRPTAEPRTGASTPSRGDASERMRDVYRRMAQPRTTREQPRATERTPERSRSGERPSAAGTERSREPERARPAPERSREPERTRPAPERSREPERARPAPERPRREPQATPRRQAPERDTPRSRSGSGRGSGNRDEKAAPPPRRSPRREPPARSAAPRSRSSSAAATRSRSPNSPSPAGRSSARLRESSPPRRAPSTSASGERTGPARSRSAAPARQRSVPTRRVQPARPAPQRSQPSAKAAPKRSQPSRKAAPQRSQPSRKAAPKRSQPSRKAAPKRDSKRRGGRRE